MNIIVEEWKNEHNFLYRESDKKLYVSTPNGTKNILVEIVNPVFLDPENKRLVS